MAIASYLILSVALFFVMIVVQALANIKHNGLGPLAGARDELKAPTFFLERAKRSNQNMIEAMVLFTPLALVAIVKGATGPNVVLGAALFFWGRAVFAPLYWFGVPWLRTVAWAVSIFGIILIFFNLLPLI